MVYVLLDTNIIIDMVIDRKKNLSANLLKVFIKLLNYGEVKMILPAIVETETYRNLNSEFDKVGKRIDDVMDAIDGLYGISTYSVVPLDLSEYKKNAREELHKAQIQYQQYKEDYRKDVSETVELLFQHSNTIKVNDEPLMAKIQKRRVHKKAPFHHEAKESYGDGAIAETLINITDSLQLSATDKILFVTGNYVDFSEPGNRQVLHSDIVEDLKSAGFEKQVTYIRSFNNLIHPYLEANINNANLLEEFEEELEEEKERYNQELHDNLRESMGMKALGSFIGDLEQEIGQSEFADAIAKRFERLNDAYNTLEDIFAFFDDEFEINNIECSVLVSRLSKLVGCSSISTVENVKAILEWIEKQKPSSELLDKRLPDYINPYEDVEFWGVSGEKYKLSFDGLEYLTPMDGCEDDINVIIKHENEIMASGSIIVSYGYVEPVEEGIGNACDESVEYRTGAIVEKLEEICEVWETFILKEESIIEQIRDILN